MSLPQQQKTNESKAKSKFQSLNINTLYQGAASKTTSKNLPQKHGLQSLGKVPTARRAPANLPSVKSEKGGNDPTVVLVPTGGSGWAKDGEKPPGGLDDKAENHNSSAAPDVKKEPTVAAKPSGPKSWSSVTGAAQPSPAAAGQTRPQQQAYLHQKSPLFGQDFPSLRTGDVNATKAGSPDSQTESAAAAAVRSPLEQPAGKDEGSERTAAYGPGPNLRPQTFGNWTQGGLAKSGAGGEPSPGDAIAPLLPPQLHKPTPPAAAGLSKSPPPARGNPANQYKSIMPPFMDVMELPTAPPEFLGSRRGGGRDRAPQSSTVRREPPLRGGGGGRQTSQVEFVPPSIIDKEKLRRMDDLADDWTYDDENFDYNKRLQSDDEENDVAELAPTSRPDSNWADQVEKAPEHQLSHQPMPHYNFYEDMKKSAVGFVLEEEERRRNKKPEEVQKNLERARQRREEEENRYRRQPSEEYYERAPGRASSGARRHEDASKENKALIGGDRRDWGSYEDKGRARSARNMDDNRRGDNRFDERHERGDRYDSGGGRRDGYYPPRFDRRDREEWGRRDDFRRDDHQPPFESNDYGKRSGGSGHNDYSSSARPGSRDRNSGGGGARIFEDRGGRSGYWDEETSFEDAGREDKRRPERRWSGKSGGYPRRDSEKSHSGSPEVVQENDWLSRTAKPVTDWVEDVEGGEEVNEKFHLDREFDHQENDRPSRPTSRDSRVSRDSQTSKQSKGSRNSGDKLARKPLGDYAAEPQELAKEQPPRAHPLMQDYEKTSAVRKPKAPLHQQTTANNAATVTTTTPTDLRGYFRDAPVEEKRQARTALGPITREKLEAAETRELTGMTQLKKRDTRTEVKQQVELEDAMDSIKLAPLVDSDLLENISEDEDNLLEGGGTDRGEEHGQLAGNGRGGGRGGRQRGGQQQQADPRKQQQQALGQAQQFAGRGGGVGSHGSGGRGERGATRGGGGGAARVGRGGDNRMGRGGPGRWQDNEFEAEESEEARKNRKNREEKAPADAKFINQPSSGFTLRGQPSRRGRGGESGRGRIGNVGRGPIRSDGLDAGAEDTNEWGLEDADRKAGRGGGTTKAVPPRMQRKKERYTGGKEAEDGEEWETASENSSEEMKRNNERRSVENDRGRGGGGRGRAWEQRGGGGGGGRRGGQGGQSHPQHGMGQQLGGLPIDAAREQTPESGEGFKKRIGGGIENFDLHDYASVVVVDQGEATTSFPADPQEFEGMEGAGEFMQVVNRKVRGPPPPLPAKEDRRSFERQGPKMGGGGGEKVAYNDYKYREYSKDAYDKKINKNSFDRRQSKLPPRLAKQREVSRAQARTGLSPTSMEANGWPEGDKMGVFQVDDLGTTAWEKPTNCRRDKDGMEIPMDLRSSPKVGKETSGIQQTMVFENTALKSVKAGDKMGLDKAPIQLPISGKPEDGGDLKLDFTFGGGGDDLSGQGKPPMSMPRVLPHLAASQGLPASPSTDDLSAKLANTKKLWDAPGMPAVQENSVAGSSWNDAAAFNDNFEGFQPENQAPEGGPIYDKNENGGGPVTNVAKVKPQQQQLSLDSDNRPGPLQYGRMANNGMPGAIPSPPTQMGQMSALQATQPWAFQMERTSPMYNPYGAGQLSQSILMPGAHSIGTDLFTGSNGAGGYHRLQGTAGHYPGSQQNPTNNVLISQANLISGGVKHSNQIGPIGTKAGAGASSSPYLQSGLGALPNTYIQYEPSSYNYVNPTAAGMQRGNAPPPSQTAFYQTLANRQPQLALNALQGGYNHAMSQQQMRAANHVAGLPYIKSDLAGMGQANKSPLNDNFGGPGNYNGRGGGGGPPSPKTKLKMEQQQAAAKMAAGMSSMNNLNNLSHIAQMRMNSIGYNLGMGYNPSPIARPQMSGPGGLPHMGPGKTNEYYAPEGPEDKLDPENEADRAQEGGKDGDAGGPEEQPGEQEGGAPPPPPAPVTSHI